LPDFQNRIFGQRLRPAPGASKGPPPNAELYMSIAAHVCRSSISWLRSRKSAYVALRTHRSPPLSRRVIYRFLDDQCSTTTSLAGASGPRASSDEAGQHVYDSGAPQVMKFVGKAASASGISLG
jgi:hypothetical protein